MISVQIVETKEGSRRKNILASVQIPHGIDMLKVTSKIINAVINIIRREQA